MPNSSWARVSSSVAVRSSCSCAGLGSPARPDVRSSGGSRTSPALATFIERRLRRDEPDRLWVTDITEHPTREGKLYCAVVLDVFSRRVVGPSIDATQTAALVTNALGMAIEGRQPDGAVIHSDQGT
jgi:putative transposase